jgi:DNA-binding XRE family transcriptional regulator
MPFIQESVIDKINQMKESDPEFKKAFSVAEKEHQIISKIIKTRKKMGLTQKDFASILGLKQQAISTFERSGESPTLKKLVQLVDALGMEIRVIKKRKPTIGLKVHRKCIDNMEHQDCLIHD